MSQVAAVTGASEVASGAIPVAPRSPADRAFVRDVSVAVKSLNENDHAGQGREVTFSIDRATRLPVIKVVDVNTKEILNQWPAQYVLQLAAGYTKNTRDSE
jgi:uncharacterized FlaG/YvyC family protein